MHAKHGVLDDYLIFIERSWAMSESVPCNNHLLDLWELIAGWDHYLRSLLMVRTSPNWAGLDRTNQ